jgi:glyoxylase-like metal-dependent hydrolase (beta-lactamase superfamily II)
MKTLRALMKLSSALAVCGFIPAYAAAPMVKTQPGFYRMMLGDFEVTALNDGVVPYAVSRMLPTATAAQVKDGLAENGITEPVGLSYNAFLINTGGKLVLIDTGTGGKLDDIPEFHGAGHLMANLRAAGYRPEQIDEIFITHQGQDHIGGLTLGKERAFPNALVRVPKSETDMLIFLEPAKASALLEKSHGDKRVNDWLQFTRDLFEPYIRAGKFQAFDEDAPLVPGIRSMATHGHTKGHTSYVIESQGQTLVVMGDLVLMGALQFANPSLGSSFDASPTLAAEQRQRVLTMATSNDYWLAGGHLSFPGIGHVRSDHGGYLWIPANYSLPN